MLTTAAKVRPLEEFFEPVPVPKTLLPDKEVTIPLKKGSVFCLCDSRRRSTPEVIRSYHVEELYLNENPLGEDSARWVIQDDDGAWFEGSRSSVDLYKGLLRITPTSPLLYEQTIHGYRFAFKFRMPSRYRVHHLAYLRKRWPEAIPHLLAA